MTDASRETPPVIAPRTQPAELESKALASDTTFTEFLRRIRAGDQRAAEELVRRYEPLIRREVRLRIEDDRLNRVFDSMDVCQSVLGSFFVRVATGAYDLEHPEQLVKLLVAMARNKLASKARYERRERRDSRRVAATEQEILEQVADCRASPFELISGEELIEKFRNALTDEEQQIAKLRSQGLSWSDVVKMLGGSVPARRMQLFRGIERVEAQLGLQKGRGSVEGRGSRVEGREPEEGLESRSRFS